MYIATFTFTTVWLQLIVDNYEISIQWNMLKRTPKNKDTCIIYTLTKLMS